MALIKTILPDCGIVKLTERVYEILSEELYNQGVLLYDDFVKDINIFYDRFIPFNANELPALNIILQSVQYDPSQTSSGKGTHILTIDFVVSSQDSDYENADLSTLVKIKKVASLCRQILKHDLYKTLAYPRGIISRTYVSDFTMVDMSTHDSVATIAGRLTFQIESIDSFVLSESFPLDLSSVKIKINTTDKGYTAEI